MGLVRVGVISDAELLRLRDQALSWGAVRDLMHERRTDNAVRALAWMSHTRSERSGVPGCYRSFDRCVRSGWPAT